MLLSDLPWLHYLCRKRYAHDYDADLTEQWFKVNVLPNPMMFYGNRTDRAFCIVYIATYPWIPRKPVLQLSFLCADDGGIWDAIDCYRDAQEFGRRRGCAIWDISSQTEFDLAAIAKRLGSTSVEIHYRGDL